jgi:quinol monooxygenase YgiN
MFGTVYQMKPKAGQEQAVAEHLRRWEKELRPSVKGAVAGYLFKSRDDQGRLIGVAVFDSETSYRKNADDPAQDRWYRELREMLESDPEWNDGDVLVAI